MLKLHNVCDWHFIPVPLKWCMFNVATWNHSYLSDLFFLFDIGSRNMCPACNSSLTWGETNGFLLEVAIPISAKWGGMGCFLDGISAHRLPVKHPSWSSAGKCMQCVTTATNSPSETCLSMWLVRTIMWAGHRFCLYHDGGFLIR